ncbi:hypothetical protein C1H46_023832 [Malus baccata]|uniref:Protein kinase domain-containing protein n=1 Tax=Malus baccata TaxID=106549 RepID=A0A540LW87_MALBA|nr:hypothetical protein C1H46_023832 [Malus baccata]
MRCSCFGASVAERKRKSCSGSGRFGHDLNENVLENIKAFSYNELRSATDNFHPSNKIGRGGFGTVYKMSLFQFQIAAMTNELAASKHQAIGFAF